MNMQLFSSGTLTVLTMKITACGMRRCYSLLEIYRRFVSPSIIFLFFPESVGSLNFQNIHKFREDRAVSRLRKKSVFGYNNL